MHFEQVWLLFLMAPPTLWILFNSYQSSRGSFVINMFGALLLLAFSPSGFALRESSAAAEVLARALASLSEADLKRSSNG
jgi:ABC-type uncharacterized transport system permease subunit